MGEIGKTNLKIHSDKFNGIYRGVVMDNNDPLKYGRIRVKVYPMLSDVVTTNLPWAVPAYPITDGAGVNFGYFAVPDISTNVFVMFEQGDIYQPVYLGEAPDAVKGLPTSRLINYPNRKIVRTSSGLEMILDDSVPSFRFNHPTGTNILVGSLGEVTINSVNNVVINGLTVSINPSAGGTDITMFGAVMFGAGSGGIGG